MPKGSCACGAIRFEVTAALEGCDACHCSQCRKQSGHFWVSTAVSRSALVLSGEDKLTWYRSSEKIRRGLCSTCGSLRRGRCDPYRCAVDAKLVARIDPDRKLADLADDLAEIGYQTP
ncbi:MAG: GFA family protein [Deltaproteobacteria bacterium]